MAQADPSKYRKLVAEMAKQAETSKLFYEGENSLVKETSPDARLFSNRSS